MQVGHGLSQNGELLIYNMFGGLHDLTQAGFVQCRRMQTTKHKLVLFQCLVRAVVRHFAHEHDQRLFKAPPTVQKRLLPLGFKTQAAKLAFWPALTPPQQVQVTKALLALQGRFTIAMASSLDEGTLQLPRVPLTLRRQPVWRKQLHVEDTITARLPPPPLSGPG